MTSFPKHYFKLYGPNRNQYKMEIACLDDRLPPNHRARMVWQFVEQMDTDPCFQHIKTMYLCRGRPTTSPSVLLALWLYAILDGVISGRKIVEYSECHDAYKWIRGDAPVNRTMVCEFRSSNPQIFQKLLTNCLAVISKEGLLDDDEIAQDGTKVKASAGFNSYHREKTLQEHLIKAEEYLRKLDEEHQKDPGAYDRRKKAAQLRAAQDRASRINKALELLKDGEEAVVANAKKKGKDSQQALQEARATTTDPEAKKMKMGDGGFRLAYNIQYATGTNTRIIYGVEVVNTLDPGTVLKMMMQVGQRRVSIHMTQVGTWLADSAYSGKKDIEDIARAFPSCRYFAPSSAKDPKLVRKGDSEAVVKWRRTLDSEEMKEAYKRRCSTAEFTNAQLKNHGLKEFGVRGLKRANGMACLHAIAQNIMRFWDLSKKVMKELNIATSIV